MRREFQTANYNQRLAEWSEWRPAEAVGRRYRSGAGKTELVVSTYFVWQRRVFQAVTERAEVCFAEAPVYSMTPAVSSTAAVINAGELKIELCSGADAKVIRAIIQAIESY